MGSNRAPRYITILVAIILAVIGAIGTIGGALEPGSAGEWLLVAATVVMLLGVFLPGL